MAGYRLCTFRPLVVSLLAEWAAVQTPLLQVQTLTLCVCEARYGKCGPMATSCGVIDVSSLAGGAEAADAGAPSLSVLRARLTSAVETILPCILLNQ